MKINSAKFVMGLKGTNDVLENGIPQVALIGRSNVGKSSLINSLTGQKELARTSKKPGYTEEINLFLINDSFYLVDLPGYGFASGSWEKHERLQKLIYWYFFDSPYQQRKVILIIDAAVGPTKTDLEMLRGLEEHNKNVVIVANKVDKIKKSDYDAQFEKIKTMVGNRKVIPYSSEKRVGFEELAKEIAS